MSHPDSAPRLPRALRPFATGQYRILALALLLSLFGSGVWQEVLGPEPPLPR